MRDFNVTKMTCTRLIAICCLAYHLVGVSGAHELSKSRKIGQEILERKGIKTAPQNNFQNPTDLPTIVSVFFSLYQILGVDGAQGTLSVTGQFLLEWVDPDLSWNDTSVSTILLPAEQVWTPAISIKNSAAAFMDPTWQEFSLVVAHDGSVKWTPGGTLHTSCHLDLKDFPKDSQTCYIDITVAPTNVHLVNMSHEIDVSSFIESNEFTLERYTVKRLPVPDNIPHDEKDYMIKSSLRFDIKIRRQPWFFLMFLFIPTTALSVMMLMVFLVPDEKVTLCVTVMLAFAVYTLLVSETMPQVSANIPFVFYYLIIGILLTALALFCTAIVLRTHQQEPAIRLTLKYRNIIRMLMSVVWYKCCDQRTGCGKIQEKITRKIKTKRNHVRSGNLSNDLAGCRTNDVTSAETDENRGTGHVTSVFVSNDHGVKSFDANRFTKEADDEDANDLQNDLVLSLRRQGALCICETLGMKTAHLTPDDWRNERAHAAKILDSFFFSIFFILLVIDFVANYLILKIVDNKI